jgi:hypothetical protein
MEKGGRGGYRDKGLSLMTPGCGLLHQTRPASKIFTTIDLVSETGIFFGISAKAAGRYHCID